MAGWSPVRWLLQLSTHRLPPRVQVKESNGVIASRRATRHIGRPLLTGRTIPEHKRTYARTHAQRKTRCREVVHVRLLICYAWHDATLPSPMVHADSLKEEMNWSKVDLLRHDDLPQDDVDEEGEKQVPENNEYSDNGLKNDVGQTQS